MGFWVYVGINVVLSLAAWQLQKAVARRGGKPPSTSPPTADIGRPIPVMWGTCKMQPNVIWFGIVAQHEFTKDGAFAGYTYHAEMALGICWGPIDALADLIFDNSKSLRRVQDVAIGPVNPELPLEISLDGLREEIYIDANNLFGGGDKEGGIRGNVDIHFGTEEQELHYLLGARNLNEQSAWPMLCYAVFTGNGGDTPLRPFYWGTSGGAKSVHFVTQRFPSALNGAGTARIAPLADPEVWGERYDAANPAEMIYEALTNTWWGLKRSPATIDVGSFEAAAETLFDEGFGLSMPVTGGESADDIIAEIVRHIDAVLYMHPQTGLLTLTLIRADYDVDELPHISPENVRGIEFSRPGMRELSTGVKVKFTNTRDRLFVEDTAEWTNEANRDASGDEKTEVMEFLGITDPVIAARVAYREGKQVTMPFGRGQFRCDRSAFDYVPGRPFVLTSPEEEIGPIVCRATSVDYGSLEEGEMTIGFVEDVFHAEAGVTGTVSPGAAVDPSTPGGPPQVPNVTPLYSESSTEAFVVLDIDDPDRRVTLVEKRITVSGDPVGAFEVWNDTYDDALPEPYGDPYDEQFEETFAKASGVTTLFEWRVTYTNASGGDSVIAGSHLFGSGP
jgi:hypothetical protein